MENAKVIAQIGDITVVQTAHFVLLQVDGKTEICMQRRADAGLRDVIAALLTTLV